MVQTGGDAISVMPTGHDLEKSGQNTTQTSVAQPQQLMKGASLRRSLSAESVPSGLPHSPDPTGRHIQTVALMRHSRAIRSTVRTPLETPDSAVPEETVITADYTISQPYIGTSGRGGGGTGAGAAAARGRGRRRPLLHCSLPCRFAGAGVADGALSRD